MKKLVLKALPAAIALALAAEAAATPVVYGKMNVTVHNNSGEVEVNNAEIESQDADELSSNASRFGIKGKTRLTDTLNAIYKVEFEIAVDDGKSDDDELKARNTYVGLQGNFGTLIAGKHDTPVKLSQDKIDLFNDLPLGDINNTFVGENRENNIVMYTTPNLGGFSASVAVMPGEDEGGDDDGPADHVSYSVSYENGGLYLAVAGDDDVAHTDIIRVVGEYKFSNVALGAMWQDAEEADDGDGLGSVKGPLSEISDAIGIDFAEQDGYMLSAKVKLNDKWTLRAQWAESEVETADGLAEAETEQIALGLDYAFSKQTKLFGYYSLLEADGDDGVDKVDVDFDTFAIGMEHKF
jgi:predicted porin